MYVAAFSPDSQSLFTCGEDGTMRRWDMATHSEAEPPFECGTPVEFLAVAPDGRMVAVGGRDYYLHLWDLASRQVRKLRYAPAEGIPLAPVFSPDGRLLAFGTGHNIRIWDLEAGQEKRVLRGSGGAIINLRFLPDSRQLVSASELEVPMLWDIECPEKVKTLGGFQEGVRSITVSPDDRWLLVGSGDFLDPERPGEVLIFDLMSQQALGPLLAHPQAVNSISASETLLATGCKDGCVRIFTLPEGRLVRTLTNAATVQRGSAILSPDGGTLVTSSPAPQGIVAWNTATWEPKCLLRDAPSGPQNFAFSPDGSLLATPLNAPRRTIIWNMPSGTTRTEIASNDNARGAAFSADGTMLAIYSFTDIELFETKTWKALGTLKGHEHVINAIAFAPDGKILTSGGLDGSVRLWDVPALAEVAVLYDHLGSVEVVAFSNDGQWLISGGRDKTVKLRRIPGFAEIEAAESSGTGR